jgi:DNA-binding CsgD family transcriptional regulator
MPEPAPVKEKPFLGLREMQMLERLAEGRSANEIAEELFLSYYTVKTHIRNLFRRLGVGDRAHAVAVGYQRGILDAQKGPQQ